MRPYQDYVYRPCLHSYLALHADMIIMDRGRATERTSFGRVRMTRISCDESAILDKKALRNALPNYENGSVSYFPGYRP